MQLLFLALVQLQSYSAFSVDTRVQLLHVLSMLCWLDRYMHIWLDLSHKMVAAIGHDLVLVQWPSH